MVDNPFPGLESVLSWRLAWKHSRMLIHIKLIVLLATLALAQDNFSTKCDPSQCQLPDCNCGGPSVPGGYLTRSEVPQFVLLTFDDAVSDLNKDFYAKLFTPNRTNPNGCPIKATFYVSHEWTDYSQVNPNAISCRPKEKYNNHASEKNKDKD